MSMIDYQLTSEEEELYQQSMECAHRKDYEKALRHILTMEEKNADNPVALYLKVSIFLTLEKYEEAHTCLERFLVLCPGLSRV